MTPLHCSSMAHVVDRAWAFLFADPPWQVVAVRPDGVVIHRPGSHGIQPTTYLVTCRPLEWARRGEEPVTFLDEMNENTLEWVVSLLSRTR